MTDQNPRGMGDNLPDVAKQEIDRLAVDYVNLTSSTDDLLQEARELPNPIEDDATKDRYKSVIKRIRDHAKMMLGQHANEKQPHLRRGQAVDQFFFGLTDKLLRRNKTDKAGAGDVLNARLTDYDTAKLVAEQERRRKEAEALAAEERKKRLVAEEAQRVAEEAARAAARARKPETIEQKSDAAQQAQAAASAAVAEAQVAVGQAEAAAIDTLAKPADLMRSRGQDGTLSTMKQEPYAEVVNRNDLNMDALWPFFTDEAIEKALRAWAKTTGHKKQMAGAAIGHRAKSVVR